MKYNYEIEYENGDVVQLETMKEAIELYDETVAVVYSIDRHGDIVDDVTKLVAEYSN